MAEVIDINRCRRTVAKQRSYSSAGQHDVTNRFSLEILLTETFAPQNLMNHSYEIRVEWDGQHQTVNLYAGEDAPTVITKPENKRYCLFVQNDMGFRQAIKFFREIGALQNTEIKYLQYGNNIVEDSYWHDPETRELIKKARGEQGMDFRSKSTADAGTDKETSHYFQTPFVFSDLNDKWIAEVDQCPATILFRWYGAKGTLLDGISFSYEQRFPVDDMLMAGDIGGIIIHKRRVREICFDAEDFQPQLFSAFIARSVRPLTQKETRILEDIIRLSLR